MRGEREGGRESVRVSHGTLREVKGQFYRSECDETLSKKTTPS